MIPLPATLQSLTVCLLPPISRCSGRNTIGIIWLKIAKLFLRSHLVDADNYLQEVCRYIHLNPIRVGLRSGMTLGEKKEFLKNYHWSSYYGYLSRGKRR